MRLASTATIALIALGLAAPATWGAEPPKVSHSKSACVPAEGNVKVSADIKSSSPITQARVYFHSAARKTGDYYLEMRQGEAGNYWAFLPYPVSETTAVQYRIVARNADGPETATETYTVPTASSCQLTLTGEETRYANNLVVGFTSDAQPAVPDGFRCKGIVSKITAAGELKPCEECRDVLGAGGAAAGAAAGGAVASAGAPVAAWVAGAAVVAVGTASIVNFHEDCKCEPVSCIRCVPLTASTGARR